MGLFDQSFVDKVRESAAQAVQQAQVAMGQGQAKLDAFQLRRQADGLLRDLGAAYYAEQRRGGGAEAVTAALAVLDAHVAAHGPIDLPRPQSFPAAPGPAPGPADSPPSPGPPAGPGHKLDDV